KSRQAFALAFDYSAFNRRGAIPQEIGVWLKATLCGDPLCKLQELCLAQPNRQTRTGEIAPRQRLRAAEPLPTSERERNGGDLRAPRVDLQPVKVVGKHSVDCRALVEAFLGAAERDQNRQRENEEMPRPHAGVEQGDVLRRLRPALERARGGTPGTS